MRHPDSRLAQAYLRSVTDRYGGAAAPGPEPAELFERAWVLHNVALAWPESPATAGNWSQVVASLHLAFSSAQRKRRLGQPLPDPAASAMVFRVLAWAGACPGPDALCAIHERTPPLDDLPYAPASSVGANVHLLGALRAAPAFDGREAAIRKAVGFLARTGAGDRFWVDGRHASPYYATANAVMALGAGLSLTEEAVGWIERTQRPDGSWGFFESSTLEETAYCVQALACHRRAGGQIRPEAIEMGAGWLERARPQGIPAYEPLWVGTTLYAPTWVVHSAVLSALILAEH